MLCHADLPRNAVKRSKSCTGTTLGKRYIEVYPVAAAVGRSWLGGLTPPQRRRPIWEGVTPGGGGRPTQIAIFAFSATRQTAMPIRIVPRFCARGCGRFEKLLYGCRNPSRWDRTDVVAKISMLRLNIGSGMLRLSSCMLSIGRGPKAVQGKGAGDPPCRVRLWVRGQC